MPETTTTHSLDSESFYDAIQSYIDYNKPDPIAQRQLESWKMIWSDDQEESSENDGDDENNGTTSLDWKEKPEHAIRGNLEIRGDYVSVSLRMECCWTASSSSPENGRLFYSSKIGSCQWIQDSDESDKTQRKIRKKMVLRLSKDSYISKLRSAPNEPVCCANIYVNNQKFELEERVDVSDALAEGLKRALWSSASSSLDIVEVLVGLPCLPTFVKNSPRSTTKLANRAKLRLLEDAMLDECEKAGEDELIEELSISEKDTENTVQRAANEEIREGMKKRSKKKSRR